MSPRHLLLCGVVLASSACSLVVEQRTVQCKTDADCVKFAPHPFCVEGVCVESGLGPAGCFYGTPSSDTDYLNQCSTGCIDFDNCARLGLCGASPELPPLIAKP
jgi:hypothetical protein